MSRAKIYQVYVVRDGAKSLEGCWGSEEARYELRSDAEQAVAELQELYPDAQWTVEEEDACYVIYDDGRPGHRQVRGEILEVTDRYLRVQFEDNASPSTLFWHQRPWFDHLTIVQHDGDGRQTAQLMPDGEEFECEQFSLNGGLMCAGNVPRADFVAELQEVTCE